MKPTEYLERGWPLCPVCGQDELAVLETPPPPNFTEPLSWYLEREMFCYWCARVTVEAGEALRPQPAAPVDGPLENVRGSGL